MTPLRRHPRSAVPRLAGTALLVVAGVIAALTVPTQVSAATVRPMSGLPQRLDPVRDEQWQLRTLDATTAWHQATGARVTVAVIDSGVDATHPDLTGQVLPGRDFVASGDGRTDPVGHGTTVAGLIAGRSGDDHGVVGLAPDAKILPVRVLNEENRYDDALVVAKAVRWAVDHGAQVINLSLGGSGDSPALAAALDYAFARDVVVVACTGNVTSSSTPEVWYPAREPGVIAVAGLDRDESLWPGSVTGPETVLTAPATGLMGARPGGYWRVQGTSFAAPLVAATAALIRSRWPDMSAATVVARLIGTAQDRGEPGRDEQYGFGIVDPVAALTFGVPPLMRNPLDNNGSPGIAGFGSAPQRERVASAAGGSAQLTDGLPEPDMIWAAGPAGGQDTRPQPGPFGGGILMIFMLTAGALLVRWWQDRLRRTRQSRSAGYSARPGSLPGPPLPR